MMPICPTCGERLALADSQWFCPACVAKTPSLDDLLESIQVVECDEMNIACSAIYDHEHPDDIGGAQHMHPQGWWGVVNDDGVTAYFEREVDAFRFRLDLINRTLNP